MINRGWSFCIYIPLCFFLGIPCATAQGNPAKGNAKEAKSSEVVECTRRAQEIVCSLKENDPQAISLEQVPNLSRVVIRITHKSPFDECSLGEVKWEDIKQQEPISAFLQILTKYATGQELTQAGLSSMRAGAEKLSKTNAEASRLYFKLLELSDDIKAKMTDAENLKDLLTDAALAVHKLFSTPVNSEADFDKGFSTVKEDMRSIESSIKNKSPLSVEAEEVRYGIFHDQMKKLLSQQDIEPDDIRNISKTLDMCASNLAALKANYTVIASAVGEAEKVYSYLESIRSTVHSQPDKAFQQDITILPNSQKIATSTITCTNSYTKKPTTPSITVSIRFMNRPRFFVSAGPLISTINKQVLGTSPENTGTDENGVPTFKNVFAVTDKAGFQVVPFGFLNFRIANILRNHDPTKPARFRLNASFGVGVNPNTGTNEAEFFVGPSLDFGKVIIHLGDHIGRYQEGLAGGYNLGDTVPDAFPGTLPIHKVYTNGFGIAFSFKLSP